MYDSYLARSCMHAQDACRLVGEIGFKLGDVSKEGVPLYTFFFKQSVNDSLHNRFSTVKTSKF